MGCPYPARSAPGNCGLRAPSLDPVGTVGRTERDQHFLRAKGKVLGWASLWDASICLSGLPREDHGPGTSHMA